MEANTLAIVAALALLVRIGHTLHTMGAVRARSVAAVAARAAILTACVILSVYLIGRGVAWINQVPQQDENGMIGANAAMLPVDGLGVYFTSPTSLLTVLSIALLPTSLIEAATAERARVRGLMVIGVLLAVAALPMLTSIGWAAVAQFDRPRADGSYGSAASLSAVGRIWPVVVAHLIAGSGALALAKFIGARAGKYNRDGSANLIPAHSLPMMVSGDLLLMLGLPMLAAALAGDPASRMVNALLGASAATLGGIASSWKRERRIEVVGPWHAAIAGLVAGSLTGPAFPSLAIVLGVVVGLMLPVLSRKLDLKIRIDEPTGLALPHLLGALAGLTGAAIEGAVEGGGSFRDVLLLGSIALSGGFTFALVAGLTAAVPAIVLRQVGWLRVDVTAETEGLDLSQHDINAYPDFQQTLIKSYHLRQ